MRFKMHIAKDNDQCSMCHTALETLDHIFLHCKHTKAFMGTLNTFIKNKIDRDFRDDKKLHFITCNHSNPLINYVNLTAKWYISRNFQNSKMLNWDEYVKYTKFALNGEKPSIRVFLENVWNN